MKITICGGGQTGQAICDALWKKNDITLIDHDENVVNQVFSQFDIQAIHGSALSLNVLDQADTSHADVFIACTNSDEVNVVACNLAKAQGAAYVCARVRNMNYHEDLDFTKSALNLDQIINPEFRAAGLLEKIIHFPASNAVESFAEGKVEIFAFPIEASSPLDTMTLSEFDSHFKSDVLVCLIDRDGDIIIPSGDTQIKVGDTVHVTGSPRQIKAWTKELGVANKALKKLFIIGAGTATYFLLNKLRHINYHITVVEKDRIKASQLAQSFPHVEVLHGDGTDQKLLLDQGLRTYDASIALSNHDEANILISLFAHSQGVDKIFTLVNRPYLLKPLTHMGLDTIITPKQMAAEGIIRLVRKLKATRQSTITNFYQLTPNQVEAIEFKILNEAKITQCQLNDLELIDQTLIVNIQRNGKSILPRGENQIRVGDLVSLVTKHREMTDINDFVK
ncbi:Trk system potassium transporter TrkA [Aerococcus kribbianus]|uniref:Trk system potassium uptake protein TrkA n=1 Tax=Aerococcus kribbianus TaxID=2999064 RepID=A0A9X3JFT1_9LACT|nr:MULTISPECIES: Trk system potassium transporter TrkA [unclassified Aerococcus]MCZ0717382.1 Trk system potassium transporter TrkA [Aerococcus sp. YH-aer221]MCZ0725670.1 Trk system potassium transporter TrkA [Aerococcus sp. YH-aer222]